MDNGVPPHLRGHRTLAAIAFTDAVSFSARMSADEEHTLQSICRDLQLMSELCQRFEGRVLKSTGDGLLMYFTSAISAVACAVEIQQALAEAAIRLPPQDVLSHRIGIHLGDVFFSDDDVMGNGVNIAARLQTLAAPGGICMSQTVYDVVKNGLSLSATYLGPRELKNITEAVPVYQILLTGPSSPSLPIRPPSVAAPRQDHRDRTILLNKVKNYWIQGVLETSLHDRTLLELGLENRFNAVDRPWGLVWESPECLRQSLPPGTRALDKFKDLGAGRTLLILGEPGAGKTTTLLELTRDLIASAELDFYHPLPVIFNLSSWQGGKQSIADWLVQELKSKYQVSPEIGSSWIHNQQLLLMLDGLDEVSATHRSACVEAINQFIQDFGQTEIVACCRIKDYEALSHRLRFQGAIYLQPLNLTQIQDYLAGAGDSLNALSSALATDPQLQELAQSPLMLNIMAIAYRGLSLEDLPELNLEARRQHLFDTYIQRMFQRKGISREYPPPKAMRWLIWLAQRMCQESQTVFLIERMQPTWLKNRGQKIMYAIGILFIYFLGCGWVLQYFLPWDKVAICLLLGAGISAFIFDINRIQPVETLKWSWKRARLYLPLGIFGGVTFASAGKLVSELLTDPLHWQIFSAAGVEVQKEILTRGLAFGIGFGVVFGLIRGWTGPGIEKIAIPNQGIWQSARNSLLFASIAAVVMGLAAIAVDWNPLFWGSFGVLFGLGAGGGEACIKHSILRLILYYNGNIPGNYAKFLDWATERIFLQKVGGGYIFIHRLLLEHFAAIDLNSTVE